MRRSSWPAIIAVATLAACGSASPTGEWSGEVIDSAGISIVRNPATGLWRPGDEPTVREVLRIGEAEGAPEYQFGEIGGVNVDGEGRIYVGDSQAREVRVYGESGEYLRTIGRAGSGPGELGPGATSVLLGRGDTLYIPDPGQQRVNVFLQDGTYVRSFRIPMADGISMKWAVTPEYELLQHRRQLPLPGMEIEEGPDLILRRGPDGAILDTIMSFSGGESVRFSGGMPTMRIFAPAPWWEASHDGRIYFAVNSSYRIEVRDPDGSVQRLIERPFNPQPVTEADRELLLDFLRKIYERQGIPAAALQMVMQNITFADNYPAFSMIMAGPDGSIWVQQVTTAERAAEGGEFSLEELGAPEWDVFDRDGRYLGVVTMPDRFQPRRFLGNRLYGVSRDDLDVPYVVVLELSRPLRTG